MKSFYDENYFDKKGKYYGHFVSPKARDLTDLLFPVINPGTSVGHTEEKKLNEKTTKTETSHRHILATPLVDVLSITIGSRLDNGDKPTMCEIYGKIRVIDIRKGGREILSLFHKDKDNPECIKFGEPLLLTPSVPVPVILPSKNIRLDVHLFDRNANNMVIAKDEIVLDKTGDECEEDHIIDVYGEDEWNFARVNYTVFQYAVSAMVDVLFFSKDDNFDLLCDEAGCRSHDNGEKLDKADWINYDSRDTGENVVADVYGSVTARSNVNNGNGDYCSVSLFSNSPEQGVLVKSGGFIQLSRSVVAVPAYSSSLVIKVDLSHRQTMKPIASGSLEFKPNDEYTFKKDLVGEGGRVRVRVTWSHASDQQPYRECEKNQKYQTPKEEEYNLSPIQRLEVFSVDVRNKDFKPFSFYGTIFVKELLKFRIFGKDESCPQVCRESGALATLKAPYSRSVNAIDHFSLHLDLKDVATGAQISRGYASWDSRLISPWLDRRLCSVIRGERGFAAVHYTAFFDGISATVGVKLNGEHLPGYVYGKIVARYGTYEYVTAYDKKYYQIIMFDRQLQDEGSQKAQTSGSSIPLLKPVICVPRNSTLIIEADLTICPEPPFDCKLP